MIPLPCHTAYWLCAFGEIFDRLGLYYVKQGRIGNHFLRYSFSLRLLRLAGTKRKYRQQNCKTPFHNLSIGYYLFFLNISKGSLFLATNIIFPLSIHLISLTCPFTEERFAWGIAAILFPLPKENSAKGCASYLPS